MTLRGPAVPRLGTGLNDLGIITDGAVLIRNGVIFEVGPSRRVENVLGLAIPLIGIAAFEASAAAKLRLALGAFPAEPLPAILQR